MPNVAILVASHSENKGEEAIIKVLVHNLMKDRYRDLNLSIIASNTTFAYRFRINVPVYENPLLKLIPNRLKEALGIPSAKNRSFSFKESIVNFLKTCCIVFNSGDILTNAFKKVVYLYLLSFLIPKLLRKRVILWAQTVDIPYSTIRRLFYKIILNLVDVISVRDRASLNTLVSLNIRKPTILLVPDPALALPPIENYKLRIFREALKRPILGLCPSSTFYHFYVDHQLSSLTRKRKHINRIQVFIEGAKFMARLINILSNYFEILLIPHSYSDVLIEDDLFFSKVIKQIVSKFYGREVHVLEGRYPSETLKYAISQVDFLLTFRMHPALHALSTRVPFLVIDYSGKAKKYFKDLGLEKCVLKIEDIRNESDIAKRIIYLYNNRDKILSTLAKIWPKIRNNLLISLELLRMLARQC